MVIKRTYFELKMREAELNLILGWLWMILGFAGGLVLGMRFHQPEWLGGYASHKRRLYRLAHISFFGLSWVNFMFFVTTRLMGLAGPTATIASYLYIAGAVSMPTCCFLMAHWPQTRSLFAIPVASLLTGGVLTLLEVAKL